MTRRPHPLRVLVVDDDPDADTLRGLVRSWGHRAAVALDGPSALRLARAYPPDVLLLQLALRRAEGWQLAQSLRTEPALDGVLLVAVSDLGVLRRLLADYAGRFGGRGR
jgi:CheY-like chemotaxis protein